MKLLTRKRIMNRYVGLSMISLLLTLLVSFYVNSEVHYWLFKADFTREPDLIGSDPRETVLLMIEQMRTWEFWIDCATRYTIYVFPLFALLPILQFTNENAGFLSFTSVRIAKFKRFYRRTILRYSVIAGLCITIPYVVFFSIGYFVAKKNLNYIGEFANFLGANFYNEHPFIFYLFMSCTMYFAIGFTFGLAGIAISLWFEKKYYVIIIPMVYYLTTSYLAGGVETVNIMYSVVAYNTLLGFGETFLPLVPVLAVSIAAISVKLRNGFFE